MQSGILIPMRRTVGADQDRSDLTRHYDLLAQGLSDSYAGMFREPGGPFRHGFLTPGSRAYADVLWDWDAWLSNVALRQILHDTGSRDEAARALSYERGCVLNALAWGTLDGWLPIAVARSDEPAAIRPADIFARNMRKPCLAQHAAFLVREDGGNAEWLREGFPVLQAFVNNYRHHHRHPATGLFYWRDDLAIGVDNDPCTYGRPAGSSGSIFLNALMFKELEATAYLCERLGLGEIAPAYQRDAERLRAAVQEHCWDERDGFFYSVDLNLEPVRTGRDGLHVGAPRHWDCLIQRLGVWSGFLALWAGLATPEQAERVVREHYLDERTFHAPFGVRTLSKMEKMYDLRASGNPSSWLGPVWGVSNYLTFRGLVRCGFEAEARDLAEKTVRLFGRDYERFGALHEYYLPETGEPVLNRGFQNWNLLVVNMISWLKTGRAVAEF